MSAMRKKMRQGYREEVRKNIGRPFDLEDFFNHFYKGNEEEPDYGASVIITSNQVISIPNMDEYSGFHFWTQQAVVEEIYDLPDELTASDKSRALVNKNIRIDLTNERGIKQIVVWFPEEITKGHVDLLQAYQKTYGDIVEKISIEYSKGRENFQIVVFDDGSDSDNRSHSFENAIAYAKTLPIVEEQEPLTEFIIGQVIPPEGGKLRDSSKLKSLKSFNDEALNRGVTTADCNSFGGYIKSLLKKMIGGR